MIDDVKQVQDAVQALVECGHPLAPGEPLAEKIRNLCSIIQNYAELHRAQAEALSALKEAFKAIGVSWEAATATLARSKAKRERIKLKFDPGLQWWRWVFFLACLAAVIFMYFCRPF